MGLLILSHPCGIVAHVLLPQTMASEAPKPTSEAPPAEQKPAAAPENGEGAPQEELK